MIFKMRKLINYVVVWILLWPLAIAYKCSKNKEFIYADTMADMKHRKANFTGTTAVLYVFFLDRYYRTLFYHRLGVCSCIFSWIWRPNLTFFPVCHNLGGGCFLSHPCSTFLNAKSIGNNFSCRQNTTIGNKSEENPAEIPTIGNNVTVGANVVIIGNIHIGNNVVIGAGSVVVKNVPDNAIVVGNPARVLKIIEPV